MVCLDQPGKVEQLTLRATPPLLPWEFRVYTPPCYEQLDQAAYPLLILIHGSNNDDSQWDLIGVDESADRLIQSGQIAPMIILMPRDRQWVDPLDDPFREGLIDEILPWVDLNYRTVAEREFRAIGGLSRGASWAVHLGLSNWTLFSAIGGHSLPVFVSDPARIKRWLDEIPPQQMPRFYLDIGHNDYLRQYATWFEELLTARGHPTRMVLISGPAREQLLASPRRSVLALVCGRMVN